jgi:hypothetical protein
MDQPPIEEPICDITVLEFVPNTINPTLPPMRLERNIITLPVEGYQWVSQRCVYYKSSGMSNASTDDEDKMLIRKYMWFPILGLVQPNSLIDLMFKSIGSIGSIKKNGVFIKNIRVDLRSLYNGNVNTLTNFESKILDARFNSYDTRFFVSTYLDFLREIMPGANVSKEFFDTEIKIFNKFIGVMSQYCYNWKQLQYSVRLSYNNIVDTVPLLTSIFKNACLFILNYDLQNEFSVILSLWVKLDTQLTPITITFSQTMQTIEDPIVINNILLRKLAVNEELIITPQNPTISKEEIKTKINPFKGTLILGTPFTNTVTVSTPTRVVKVSKKKKQGTKVGGKNKISKSKKNKKQKTHKKRKSVKKIHK